MTVKSQESHLIGPSDIAELAGVSPSAVSNWRKRHRDFPIPRVELPSGALFDSGEVESWLIEHEKIEPQQMLWNIDEVGEWIRRAVKGPAELDALRQSLAFVRAAQETDADLSLSDWRSYLASHLNVAGEQQASNQLPIWMQETTSSLALLDTNDGEISPATLENLTRMVATILESDRRLDAVLDDAIDSYGWSDRFSGEYTTPEDIATLMVSLVQPIGHTVFDPAVGTGRLLMSAVLRDNEPHRAIGWDKSVRALAFAKTRAYLVGLDGEWSEQDSLTSVEEELPKADTVVLDPPFGLTKWGTADVYRSSRWQFGATTSSADLAWVQLAVSALTENGRAVVALPLGACSRQSDSVVRSRLVEAGVVESVIQLPPRLRRDTSIPIALWVLVSVEQPSKSILMVDAATLGSLGRSVTSLDPDDISRIARILQEWRTSKTVSEDAKDLAVAVTADEVSAGGSNLLPARYVRIADLVPLEALQAKSLTLKSELRKTTSEFFEALTTLNEILENS